MVPTTGIPELVEQKLAAFERMRSEFEECFRFIQAVHGQKHFYEFSVSEIVYYLHALWLCECKDRLLSIYKDRHRYEGRRCLELLRAWQEGQNVEVVAFLTNKLDLLSFTAITARLDEARRQQRDEILARRLEHGRLVVLNRGINLLQALKAMFSLPENDLWAEVCLACERYGHAPAQIEAQLAEMGTALYAHRVHPLLAQQNMGIMNKLEVDVVRGLHNRPGERCWSVTSSDDPRAPFAEQVISGYIPLSVRL